jgi:hypothetical protein
VRFAKVELNANWIETTYNNINSPDTFYAIGGSTLVEISYFRVISLDSAVILEWATETELDNAGFNILRSEEKDGKYGRINPYFIPAQGDAGFGAEYSFTDYDVTNGGTYYYKLEDIDIYGNSSFHGPVPAILHDVVLIWPPEGEILPSGALLFSWASCDNYSFKVEISMSPSFSGSETLSFPEEKWISANSLWLAPKEWELVLRRAKRSGGQLFWRVRAKGLDGRFVCSHWRRFLIEWPN